MSIQLQACPYCHHKNYSYGTSIVETLKQNFSLENPSTLLFGFANIFFKDIESFKLGVIDKIPYTPLLRCKHCYSYVIMCPLCQEFMVLSNYPGISELINCQKCKATFTASETSKEFDKLLLDNQY